MENLAENYQEPFLANQFGDKFLYSVNRESFKKLGSDELFREHYGESFFKKDTLYLMVGTDSGLLVKYLLKRGIPEGSRFIFLELPHVLERLSEVLDFSELPKEIAILTIDNLNDQLGRFNVNDYVYSDKGYLAKSLCATDCSVPEYHELYDTIRFEWEMAISRTRNNLGGKRYALRQLENLAENRVPASIVKDLFKGKTGVLLGVGPSLDEFLPWVKANRNRLVVIAVSRASRRLVQENIAPDLIFSIDPTDFSFDVSREMLHFWEKSVFVYGYHVSPPLVGQWPGKGLYLGPRFPWDTPLNVETFPTPGPTVTQVALQSAIELGLSQIILGGVDLCFSQDGYIYGKVTKGREKGPTVGNIKGGVETNGGWKAETIHAFLQAAEVTERMASQALKRGCQIYNIAAGAMKIPNVRFCPVEEIVFESLDRPARETLAEDIPEESIETRLNHYQTMLDELLRAKQDLIRIKALAEEALKANDGLFGRDGRAPDFRCKKKMDRVEKKLDKDFGVFTHFVKRFGVLRFLRIVQPNWDKWTDEGIERTGRLYYEAFRDTSREILEFLEKSEKRLRMRLEEEAEIPDLTALISQWHDDKQYGRGWIWKLKNPEKYDRLDSEAKSGLLELENKFQRIMSLEENLSPDSEPKKLDPAEIRSKARFLFKRRDARALGILRQGVIEKGGEEFKPMECLIRGFVAEIDGEPEQALEAYEWLVAEGKHSMLEDALIRIADISMEKKDHQNVLLALDCLAGLSPLYAPKYADLLWCLGQKQLALEVYAEYLGKVPKDLVSMLRLGKYYLEIGSREGARMAIDYVLEKDPDNSTARTLLEGLADQ
jgi:hypothetical protein